jgi:hypothetical protein
MLLGGVLSIIWAMIYKVFGLTIGLLAWVQTLLYQIAALVMIVALYMLYGGMQSEATVGPVLGVTAIAVIVSTALVLVLSLRARL